MAAPMDVVFSFDTTGSMSQVLDEVKCRLNDLIQRLQADIPQFKVGVIAHGDYCDKNEFYDIRTLDLTDNLADVVSFVSETTGTGGGDIPECYELALRHARDMSWREGSRRVFVVIGDAYPHGPDYAHNTLRIDWQEELSSLVQKSVTVYGVQYGQDAESVAFFQRLSGLSGGQHLRLQDMGDICHAIMAICYREQGPDLLQNYEAEVRADNAAVSLKAGLENMFNMLGESQPAAPDVDPLLEFAPVRLSTVSSFRSVCSADTTILHKDDNNNENEVIMNGSSKNHLRSITPINMDIDGFPLDEVDGAGLGANGGEEVTGNGVTNNGLKRRNGDCVRPDCNFVKRARFDDDSSLSSWDDTFASFRIIRPPFSTRNPIKSVAKGNQKRKAAKKVLKHKASPVKNAKETLKKAKRHAASDKHFKFNNLPWSKWHLATSKTVPEDSGSWKRVAQRGCDDTLWREDLLRLVESNMMKALNLANQGKELRSRTVHGGHCTDTKVDGVLFELGVIPFRSRNIQTVWLHATNRRTNRPAVPNMLRQPWYLGLTRSVKGPLTTAVRAGSQVFLRWVLVQDVQNMKREILAQYDYLWRS